MRKLKTVAHWAFAVAIGVGATAPALAYENRPVAATEYDMAQWAPHEQARDTGLSRAEVRDSLRLARLLGLVDRGGERGEADDVLTARETYNALQTEVIAAEALREDAPGTVVED